MIRWREHLETFVVATVVVLVSFSVGIATALIADDDPEPTLDRLDVAADVLVDATAIEMHGFGPDGKPGVFVYDCVHDDAPALGDPTLICTQRDLEP